MKKRPFSIAVMGWIFIVVGIITFVTGLLPLIYPSISGISAGSDYSPHELGLILSVRILAVLGGAFLLRGFNWARWLLLVWMGYHVILSIMHPPMELLVHTILFAVVLYFLFRPKVSAYFQGPTIPPQTSQ